MRQNLHDFINIGIVHFMAYPYATSSEEYLYTLSTIIEDEFFSAVEIKSAPDKETAEQARTLLETSGVIVGFSGHPALISNQADLNSMDKKERQRAVGYLIESIQEVCQYARSKGNLEILLEPFDYQIDFRCLIGPSEIAVEVAHEVRKIDPSFGLMVDLSHLPMLGELLEKALTTTRDYLKHAHMGNCLINDSNDPLYGDKHPRFGYPGSEIDIPELTNYLRTLLDIGYLEEGKNRTLAFEIKPAPGESSTAIIAHAKQTLRTAWQQV